MDIIDIRLSRHEEGLDRWTAVELTVNGRPFNQLVAEFERSQSYESAGGYGWLSLGGMQPAPDRLTGRPDDWPRDGHVVLLVCEGCREEGCWPLLAMVRMGSGSVTWTGFSQPHRPERDYSELRFEFGREQYDAALAGAFGQAHGERMSPADSG